jgi:transmembrane sensor
MTQELLFNYFAGRITALQKTQIDQWVAESNANEEFFYDCLDAWERRQNQFVPNIEAGLEHYRCVLAAPATLVASDMPVVALAPRPGWYRWGGWLVAASVLLALTGWLGRDTLRYQTYQTAYGQTQTLQLPDGSRVTLNANSKLRLPRFGFGNRTREVYLSGEAAFAVQHLPGHQQFVVHTLQGLNVTVLGTEFSVFSRARGFKIVLTKGKVALSYPSKKQPNQVLTMRPGDLVAVGRGGQVARQVVPQPETHAAWTQHQFVFENTTLDEIGQMLTETYGLRMTVADSALATQTLTGSFHANSADELLQAISEVLNINVIRHDSQVTLTDH